MSATIVMAPLVRALWLWATSSSSVALLHSDQIPTLLSLLVAACWAMSLLIGRRRGPALLPPFLVYALAASDLKRSQSLCGPVTRTALWVSLAASITTGFVAAALVHAESATLLIALGLVGAGLAAGVIATMCALIGQVFPRAAAFLASGILATALIVDSVPFPLLSFPWGWVAAAFPAATLGSTGVIPSLVGLAALALGFVLVTPSVLNRVSFERLSTQAAQWDAAVKFSSTLDLSLTATVYRERPRMGRHIQAVRNQRGLLVVFFLRDAIGLTRTPGRLAAAVVTTVAAGTLLPSMSTFPVHPALPAALAAALLYFATGVFGQGLQHAAHVAADYPLYGISDRSLIGYHSLFPIASIGVLVTATIAVTSVANGVSLVATLPAAFALVTLVLLIRLSASLKGPLPTRLLAPVESPAGDLSILAQLAWAFGEPLLTVLAGLAVVAIPRSPIPVIAVTAWVLTISLVRWRWRR